MPAARKSSGGKGASGKLVSSGAIMCNEAEYNFDSDSPVADSPQQLAAVKSKAAPSKSSSRAAKRPYEDGNEFDGFSSTSAVGGGDMQAVLNSFGSDISKTMDQKRKRLEAFSQASIKCSNRKVEEIWKIHQEERGKLQEQYMKQLNSLVTQWESDMQKSKDSDEKLQTMLRQQQKAFQQQRVTQQQKLMSIKQLAEQFTKSTEKLDTCHQQQQVAMQADLRKEMAMLQKKMLMDSQSQEISQVRKTLQTMLAQV